MSERCAVVGVGQTHHVKVRDDVSFAGLLREAGQRALDDAEMTWKDVDAVVIGTAPDSFEGVMMPELYLADALGAAGKPIMRVHTAGSVGGSTAIVASHLVQSGVRERVLTIAFEKQSEGDTTWGLSGGRSGGVGAGGYFAPHIRAYIARSKAPEYVGWMVAVKDRLNALKNPYAHLRMDDITLEMVRVRRCVRDGAHEREGRRRRIEAGRVGARHRDPQRAGPVPRPRPGEPEGGPGLRGRRLRAGRHHQPAQGHRRRRVLRAVQLV
jgi:acetyl-CoA C-acetyltransferase